MADTNPSANMSLPIPSVGVDSGPDWANNLNACFTIVDSHDHSVGNGVSITPSGLNINSDLTFGSNNAIALRSVRFTSQGSTLAGASDLNCAYTSGVDLYYNDGSGNKVRITQSGGVAGSPGSISNLNSPASATYVSGTATFVWQSAANTPANMDNGSVIFRNIAASSKGLTLGPPLAMGADYALTLPALPGVNSVMTLSTGGAMGSVTYDTVGSSMTSTGANAIAASMTSTGTNSIIATMGATGANSIAANRTRATGTSVGAGGIAVSSTISYTNTTITASTVATVTITTSGRPVMILLSSDGTTTQGKNIEITGGKSASLSASLTLYNGAISGANVINSQRIGFLPTLTAALSAAWTAASSAFTALSQAAAATAATAAATEANTTGSSGGLEQPVSIYLPPSTLSMVHVVGAGTYTYTLQAALAAASSGTQITMSGMKLIAYEL